MEPVPSLRPRTVGELLDGSFVLYRRYFGRLLLVATAVSLPALIVAGLTAEESTELLRNYIYDAWESARRNQGDPMQHLQDSMISAEKIQPLTIMTTAIQAISRGGAYVTMAIVVGAAAAGRAVPGWWQILRRALPRMPVVIFVQAVLAFSMNLVACCCFPLAIVLVVVSTPLPAVIALEHGRFETRIFSSLRSAGLPRWIAAPLASPGMLVDGIVRSFVLSWHGMTIVRGSFFSFFLALFVGFFVIAISVALGLLIDSVAAWFWIQHYAEVIFLPVSGIACALWYVDLRVRREGLGLVPGAPGLLPEEADG